MEKRFAVAVKCMIESKRGFLILKKTFEESKDDVGSNPYDLPGGRVEYGEYLIVSVIREIKEETGLDIDLHTIVLKDAKSILRPDGLHLILLYYYCYSENTTVTISAEYDDFCWMSRNVINDTVTIPAWIKALFKV